jgi:hypothetical protein
MSESPYARKIETQFSTVVCLDVLGFQKQIEDAYKKGTANELLSRFHDSLAAACGPLEEIAESIVGGRRFFDIKRFTDNMVIGQPLWDHNDHLRLEQQGETELGTMFTALTNFQLRMVLDGFFIRGAISCGDLYMDEHMVFGDGLVDAHRGEDELARDPRIVITESAKIHVREHLKFYLSNDWAPQSRALLIDSDGRLFINYLDVIECNDNYDLDILDRHATVVRNKLAEFSSDTRIWRKYAWVAHYHNFYCEQIGANELKIDPGWISANIRTILDDEEYNEQD